MWEEDDEEGGEDGGGEEGGCEAGFGVEGWWGTHFDGGEGVVCGIGIEMAGRVNGG